MDDEIGRGLLQRTFTEFVWMNTRHLWLKMPQPKPITDKLWIQINRFTPRDDPSGLNWFYLYNIDEFRCCRVVYSNYRRSYTLPTT
jgi:hypothetical protein